MTSDVPRQMVVEIVNMRGLHARASARVAAVAGAFDANIRLEREGYNVGATSIMGLLTLGAGKGTHVTLTATGPQAHEALDTLVKLVADKFGEAE